MAIHKEAIISKVRLDNSTATFEADNMRWCYAPSRGRLYLGATGSAVHQSADGSYAITEGHSFGQVCANARLLGASIYRKR